MEYKIVVEEHAGQKMLHTYIKGTLSIEERDRIGAEALQKLSEEGITKSIWDVREAELGYSLFEVHQSVLKAKDDLRNRHNNYIVIIYQRNRDEFEHAKLASYNRSIYNMDFFQNIEDGIQWLADKK